MTNNKETNMKKFLKAIYRFFSSIVYRSRCLRYHIHYQKGLVIKNRISISGGTKVIVSKNCHIGKYVCFWGGGVIKIGENSSIGSYSAIFASKEGGVTIGDNVNCARNMYVIDANHGFKDKNVLICKQPLEVEKVTIGDNCWIGANCTIIKGAEIGSGCVVGACSLVNKKFGNDVVIAGVPAKVIKER